MKFISISHSVMLLLVTPSTSVVLGSQKTITNSSSNSTGSSAVLLSLTFATPSHSFCVFAYATCLLPHTHTHIHACIHTLTTIKITYTNDHPSYSNSRPGSVVSALRHVPKPGYGLAPRSHTFSSTTSAAATTMHGVTVRMLLLLFLPYIFYYFMFYFYWISWNASACYSLFHFEHLS